MGSSCGSPGGEGGASPSDPQVIISTDVFAYPPGSNL